MNKGVSPPSDAAPIRERFGAETLDRLVVERHSAGPAMKVGGCRVCCGYPRIFPNLPADTRLSGDHWRSTVLLRPKKTVDGLPFVKPSANVVRNAWGQMSEARAARWEAR
jgi:hypothetical protein